MGVSMTVNLNVIEPVSPYTTDVFRADYPHPYLAAGKVRT